MKQTPLKQYRKPGYPELNRESEARMNALLKKRLPARWKRFAASAAMLCAAAGLDDGCAPAGDEETEWVDRAPRKGSADEAKSTVAVAPLSPKIFEYARGCFGCEAISPPVYLSEDEAKEIIFDELAKAGIHLQPGVTLHSKPENPESATTGDRSEWAFAFPEKQSALELPIDWVDREKGVAIEFMTRKDADFWGYAAELRDGTHALGRGSTAHSVDFGRGASFLSETAAAFKGEQPLKLGIFTLPLIKLTKEEWRACYAFHQDVGWFEDLKLFMKGSSRYDEGQKKWKAYLKEKGRDGEPELRAQVQHFIKWLEEQEKKP